MALSKAVPNQRLPPGKKVENNYNIFFSKWHIEPLYTVIQESFFQHGNWVLDGISFLPFMRSQNWGLLDSNRNNVVMYDDLGYDSNQKKSSRAHDLNGSWSPITSSSEVAAKMANANQGFSASSTLAFAFKIWWLVHYMWQEWYRRRNESIKKSGYIIDMWPSPSNNFGSFQITWAVSVSPFEVDATW